MDNSCFETSIDSVQLSSVKPVQKPANQALSILPLNHGENGTSSAEGGVATARTSGGLMLARVVGNMNNSDTFVDVSFGAQYFVHAYLGWVHN